MQSPPLAQDLDRQLRAVDEGAKHVGGSYVTFLLFGFYLVTIVASTSDEQLLTGERLRLPLLDAQLPLIGFYIAVPCLFLLLHFNLLLQHFLLSRKVMHLRRSVLSLTTDASREEAIDLLFPLPFSQMLLAHHHPRAVRRLVEAMVMTTSVLLPLLALVATQVRFLPYHRLSVTWTHRAAIVVDLVLLWILWPLAVSEGPGWRQSTKDWLSTGNGYGRGSLLLATVAVTLFSFFVATIPGELVDALPGTAWAAARLRRDLSVRDTTIADGADLRGRDLRRSDLRGSRLVRADLRGACLDAALLDEAQLTGADLSDAKLRRASLRATGLQRANLDGADLSSARVERAHLDGTDLVGAVCQGATFDHASATGASFAGATANAASFEFAVLEAAHFVRADLRATSFVGADLRGADMSQATVIGAQLSNAVLERSSLMATRLGATFGVAGADLRGADLRRVSWTPPSKSEISGALRLVGQRQVNSLRNRLHEEHRRTAGQPKILQDEGALHDDTQTPDVIRALFPTTKVGERETGEYDQKTATQLVALACRDEFFARGAALRALGAIPLTQPDLIGKRTSRTAERDEMFEATVKRRVVNSLALRVGQRSLLATLLLTGVSEYLSQVAHQLPAEANRRQQFLADALLTSTCSNVVALDPRIRRALGLVADAEWGILGLATLPDSRPANE